MKIAREITPLKYDSVISQIKIEWPFIVGYYLSKELVNKKTEESLLLDSIVDPILDELKNNNVSLADKITKDKMPLFMNNWRKIDDNVNIALSTLFNYLARKCFSDKLDPQIIYDFRLFRCSPIGYPIRAGAYLLLTEDRKIAITCAPVELRKIILDYVKLSNSDLAERLK